MKTHIHTLLILLIVGCTTTAKPEKKSVAHNEENAVESSADLAHISFPIKGMTCAVGCAARIEKKIAAADGVTASKVDFESETAHVSFDPSATSFENIRTTIEALGADYKVGEATTSAPYNYMKEGKQCPKDCDKPCCKEKHTCDKSCTKENCKKGMDKKACAKDCK